MQNTHVDKEKPDDNTLKRFLLLILLTVDLIQQYDILSDYLLVFETDRIY